MSSRICGGKEALLTIGMVRSLQTIDRQQVLEAEVELL